MIMKYYIICLMVINTMETSKQLSVEKNAGSKVSAILKRVREQLCFGYT